MTDTDLEKTKKNAKYMFIGVLSEEDFQEFQKKTTSAKMRGLILGWLAADCPLFPISEFCEQFHVRPND